MPAHLKYSPLDTPYYMENYAACKQLRKKREP